MKNNTEEPLNFLVFIKFPPSIQDLKDGNLIEELENNFSKLCRNAMDNEKFRLAFESNDAKEIYNAVIDMIQHIPVHWDSTYDYRNTIFEFLCINAFENVSACLISASIVDMQLISDTQFFIEFRGTARESENITRKAEELYNSKKESKLAKEPKNNNPKVKVKYADGEEEVFENAKLISVPANCTCYFIDILDTDEVVSVPYINVKCIRGVIKE
jgi:hypothetical protein